MEKDKKDIIIIILLVIIFILVGVVVYKVVSEDEVIEEPPINEPSESGTMDENDESSDDGTGNENDESEDIVMIAEKVDLYETLRDNDIDPLSNVQNKTLKIGKINFTFDCGDYDGECKSLDLYYKNKKIDTAGDSWLMYVTSEQIITINGSYMSTMKVYDYDGKLIYDDKIVKEYNTTYGGYDPVYLGVELEDNKLIFYTCDDTDIEYSETNKSTIYKNAIDLLDGYKISRVGQIKGYIGMW